MIMQPYSEQIWSFFPTWSGHKTLWQQRPFFKGIAKQRRVESLHRGRDLAEVGIALQNKEWKLKIKRSEEKTQLWRAKFCLPYLHADENMSRKQISL